MYLYCICMDIYSEMCWMPSISHPESPPEYMYHIHTCKRSKTKNIKTLYTYPDNSSTAPGHDISPGRIHGALYTTHIHIIQNWTFSLPLFNVYTIITYLNDTRTFCMYTASSLCPSLTHLALMDSEIRNVSFFIPRPV